jgi:hypothetical protein
MQRTPFLSRLSNGKQARQVSVGIRTTHYINQLLLVENFVLQSLGHAAYMRTWNKQIKCSRSLEMLYFEQSELILP